MSGLSFYLILPFIFGISLLPFWLLYRLSDILFLLLYYIIGYRRNIVLNNLRNAFPEKSLREIKKIRIRFFRYFCDFILENLKLSTISNIKVRKRCVFSDEAARFLDELYEENRSIILVLGHYGNWEMGSVTFCLERKHEFFAIYKPLRNKYFNRFLLGIRSRFGARLITMKEAYRTMFRHRKSITATAFLSDQTPPPEHALWLTFLNQDTPVFKGTEHIARKLNLPVVYMSIRRTRRGYYRMTTDLLVKEPSLTRTGEITEKHTRRLEQDIHEQPEIWLWSHRRWKHVK